MRETNYDVFSDPKTGNGLRRPRMLLITPFTPLRNHGHAADDLAHELVATLATRFDLVVYAPGQDEELCRGNSDTEVTFARGTEPKPSFLRHFGLYPAGLRTSWGRVNTREVKDLLTAMSPDFVHVEYLQAVEPLLRPGSGQWSLTLHDVTSTVFRQRAASARYLEQGYRYAEYLRAKFVEVRAARQAKHVFTLSARDADWVRSVAPHQATSHLRIGIEPPAEQWKPENVIEPTFVFAGAMWRESNIAAAEWIAKEVMPRVWIRCPDAKLRIVGDRPGERLAPLGRDPRIQIVGRVRSIEAEYIRATAVLAPTLVDAGVLLKALRALACGAPLILNSAAAGPLEVEHNVQCFVWDTADDFACQMLRSWEQPTVSASVAAEGASYVKRIFSWKNYGEKLILGIVK